MIHSIFPGQLGDLMLMLKSHVFSGVSLHASFIALHYLCFCENGEMFHFYVYMWSCLRKKSLKTRVLCKYIYSYQDVIWHEFTHFQQTRRSLRTKLESSPQFCRPFHKVAAHKQKINFHSGSEFPCHAHLGLIETCLHFVLMLETEPGLLNKHLLEITFQLRY